MSVKVVPSKGKVYLCCLGRLKSVPKENNHFFLVTRGKRSIKGVRQTCELAPSYGLFNHYNKHWKNKPHHEWWPQYNQWYLNELNKNFLNKLKEGLDQGKNITLICFCGDTEKCHRRILGEFFAKQNYETLTY